MRYRTVACTTDRAHGRIAAGAPPGVRCVRCVRGGRPAYPGWLMRTQEWGAAHVPMESFLKDFLRGFPLI